ncbi:MAG: hypothetical protein PVG30_06795 [Gammaproteobacteria bacterium]
MNIKKIFIIILFLFASVTVMAGNISLPNGQVIYAIGGGLYSLDLATRQINNLYTLSRGEINAVSQLDANWILLGMNEIDKGNIIAKFNIKKNNMKIIGKGTSPVYLSAQHRILFSTLDGVYIADIKNFRKQRKLVKQCNIDNVPIFLASKNKAVFVTYDCNQQKTIWLYDSKSDKLQVLHLKDCLPMLWRDRTKQLVCDIGEQKYFLFSLDGKYTERLLLGKAVYPVLYLPDTDQLILLVNKATRLVGEAHNLWIYDFKVGKKELISKNNGFALGAGIFLPAKD